MKTIPRISLSDKLRNELRPDLPAKDLPEASTLQNLIEAFMALQRGGQYSSLTLRKTDVESADIQKEILLNPSLKVLFTVRQQVLELVFEPQKPALEKGASGRVTKVETSPIISPAAPLDAAETTSLVLTLIQQLKAHERVGEIPETLEQVLRDRLIVFCQSASASERFDMPEMLWARLKPKDHKWLVKAEKVMGQTVMQVSLMKIEKQIVKSLPSENGKKKEVKEDVGYLRVDFAKWKEIPAT